MPVTLQGVHPYLFHMQFWGPLLNNLPTPPHDSQGNSSKIKKDVLPRPLHREHNTPPIRASPGKTTAAPGGGTAP